MIRMVRIGHILSLKIPWGKWETLDHEGPHMRPRLRGCWSQGEGHHQSASPSASQSQTKRWVRWVGCGGVFMENQGVLQRMSSLWPGLGSKESTLWPRPMFLRIIPGKTMATHWFSGSTPRVDSCWTRSSRRPIASPTTPLLCTAEWTLLCFAGPSGTTSTVSSASGENMSPHLGCVRTCESSLWAHSCFLFLSFFFPFFLPILFFKANLFLCCL